MDLSVEQTPIPGLLVVRRPVHHDTRGWFTEAWQREKMTALGLPDFGPVQHNVSHNAMRGSTRGIHGEPWDKFVTVLHGSVFGAWVDLREGESFGATYSIEIDESVAVFVPRGVGNSYQALADETIYSYLVNEHWRPDLVYPALALDDPTVAIDWPIPLPQSEISDKDKANPTLAEVTPFAPRPPLVLGGSGQVGRALRSLLPDAIAPTRDELDLTDRAAVEAYDFSAHDLVINAAAMTAVDAAETPDGSRLAWRLNAELPAQLARRAATGRFTLVQYSSDYVFDGQVEEHDEGEPLAPRGEYGRTKAAGDLAVGVAPRHYLLRTSWVVGDGGNFVATMVRLADGGVSPSVVDDQWGRLAFADEIAAATLHLVEQGAPFGTYNVTQSGEPMTWAEIAREVFALRGRSRDDVTAVTTDEYAVGKEMAPRPTHSTLSLAKLTATGFEPTDQVEALREYVATLRDGRERPPQGSGTREGGERPPQGPVTRDGRERPPQGSRPPQVSTTEGD
ncbi:sugar nucleotide-binding protein [Janibacter limosus]|uniref:dTDP-4-dehydrorhamnose reductase n=1 Tax=Janibacter limosus TaxID=53458 RepID=A0A4P6MXM9_9MICO|nr:sugar nucleotide-binding protein [Janibacter limosus]QBF46685.1 NAD-dependent epimerase/dehydratase family protein [Janibacter limosus]